MTMGDEPILQIKGAQARHMQIGDQARCAADLLIVEKCFGELKVAVSSTRFYRPERNRRRNTRAKWDRFRDTRSHT